MPETRGDVPIEEIREIRCQITERFDHDPEKLVAYYLQLQKQYGARLVSFANRTEQKDASVGLG
jgi:hypothetical protein